MVSVICIYQGVAMSVGLCANSHLEGTLAKLEEFGKSDAFKKSPSIFNLLKVQGTFMIYHQLRSGSLTIDVFKKIFHCLSLSCLSLGTQ